jgi:hypothetical protein
MKFYLSLLLVVAGCTFFSCKSEKKDLCIIKKVNTLFTTIGIHDNDTGYAHYVLLKDFSRKCIDSITILKVARAYIDSVKLAKPIKVILFFDSDKHFYKNETSQDMDEINKNCLVVIGFNNKQNPNYFIFYNDKGIRTYWGERWLPNGRY